MRGAALFSIAAALGGCGVHPLPEDVTPLDTNAIVLQIRCEAREGPKEAALAFLLNPKFQFPEKTLSRARELASGEIAFADFSPNQLDPVAGFYLAKYEQAAIGYDFQFDMSVTNALSAGTSFTGIVPHQIVNAGAAGGVDLARQTIRNFRVTDTFGKLRQMKKCDEGDRKFENYAYPVTGRIGLAELVRTFVDLNEINNLSGPVKDGNPTAPILADTFAFSTKLAASVGADVNLTPATPRFHLLKANFGAAGSRTDAHKVVVAMSLDPKTTPAATASFLPAALVGLNSTYAGFGKTPAEKRTLIEIDYQKTLNSLNNIALRPN
ncbi:hypothetical protein [Methylocystis echinoides]|nr:hypothetical protein [Methylocystis echinoides]